MSDRVYNVLFLCTGNSARSILAESLLNAQAGATSPGIEAARPGIDAARAQRAVKSWQSGQRGYVGHYVSSEPVSSLRTSRGNHAP